MKELSSNEELIEIYKVLYLRDGNTEYFMDYEAFIRLYRDYLFLFFSKDGSFYCDCEFLSHVVNGFHYLYNNSFGEEEVSHELLTSVLYEHNSEVRKKLNEKTESSDSDVILMYSLKTVMSFNDNNLVDEFDDLLQTTLYNAYVIRKQELRIREERNSNGVENRKRYH